MFTEKELFIILRNLRSQETILHFKYVDDDSADVIEELSEVRSLIHKVQELILPA
jgi:hypothetical protein